MGRHHHHLPEHLYLSPPPAPNPAFSLTSSSLLAFKSAIYFTTATTLLQESGRTKAFAVGDRIPGFKTSAAFLTTLRANLILDLDTPSSVAKTPNVIRSRDQFFADNRSLYSPPCTLGLSNMADSDTAVVEKPENPLDSLPELTTKLATNEDDKVEALHLIADSVAQQRQAASTAIIIHPFTVGALVLAFGLSYQYLYKGAFSDLALVGTTSAGILMSMLITVRWLTGSYIFEAERVGTWKWLNEGRDESDNGIVGSEDEILLTRYGDEIIGVIVIRGIRDPSSSSKARKNATTRGCIRAWTVMRRYRRKGIGQGLLEEALALCQSKGWQGPKFVKGHANSAHFLHPIFLGGFKKREGQAGLMLERVIEEQASSANGKKKR